MASDEPGTASPPPAEPTYSLTGLVERSGLPAGDFAPLVGMNKHTLYNWKKKFSDHGDKAFPGKGHLTELAALRRKLREVEMERDILKKAVGIFSKTTENGSGS